MKQDLSAFFVGGPLAERWLVIDSSQYLGRLRQCCPQAHITAVTRYEEVPALRELQGLGIEWHVLDHRLEPLPFAKASFDHILAVSCLEEAYEVYDSLMDISQKLTDVGTLYTQFQNIRYSGLLTALQQGQFPFRQQHLYAKAEIVKLLDDVLFKEIHFRPGEQDEDTAGECLWQQAGFEDFSRDLATRIWLVRAARSTGAVANLKGLYDKKTRAQLARVLHRLEYGIDAEENRTALRALCAAAGIFPEYLEDFIREACAHPERVLRQL